MKKGLQAGDQVHCDKCGEWHVVEPQKNLTADAPDHVRGMLYYFCRTAIYFAGQAGSESRLKRRRGK
jgi:hypothetical protein